jgi:hypothetical protein
MLAVLWDRGYIVIDTSGIFVQIMNASSLLKRWLDET